MNGLVEIISVKVVLGALAIERCDGNYSRRTRFHTLLDSLYLCWFVHVKEISLPLYFKCTSMAHL